MPVMNSTNENTKLPGYVHIASYGKELGAFAIDLLATMAIGLTLKYTLGLMVIAPNMGYNEAKSSYFALAVESGLYQKKEGTLTTFTFEGSGEEYYSQYETYVDKVWTYYYDLCGKTNSENTNFTYRDLVDKQGATREDIAKALEVSSENIEEYREAVGKYVYSNVFSIEEGNEEKKNAYFTYPLKEDGTPNYTLKPVLNAEYQVKVNDEDAQKRTAAKIDIFNYVCGFAPTSKNSSSAVQNSASGTSETIRNALYTKACSDFIQQPEALRLNEIGRKASYVATIPSSIIPPFIFFFLLPLFLKNGKTLGKLAVRISVAGKDGYKASKGKIALHAGLVFLPFCLLLLPFNSQINYMLWGFVFLIDFIVLLFQKSQQSVHGKLSSTIVIDDKLTPMLFENKAKEEEYCSTHQDKITAAILEETNKKEEKGPSYVNGRRSVLADMDSSMGILDSSTIGKARRDAEKIDSFDEFEAKNGGIMTPEEADAHDVKLNQGKDANIEFDTSMEEEDLKNPEIQAMMKMDGVEEIPEEVKEVEEEKEPQDPHDDGFLDEKPVPAKEEKENK